MVRSFFQNTVTAPAIYLILAAIAISFLAAAASQPFWIYPLSRQVVRVKIDYSSRNMLVKETEHFVIKYAETDSQAVGVVAAAAEAAYGPVNDFFRYQPDKKPLILVHQDKKSMKNAYGWSGGTSALGFYWGGVIQVLSPSAWVNDNNSGAGSNKFIKQGPVAHEYAHLALDYLVKGNYSRWFTEGLAQYVEYSVNGYEWITANNSLRQQWYSISELESKFDELPNQELAYRQSLALIRYIIENYGEESLHQILMSLKSGIKVEKAVRQILNISLNNIQTKAVDWAEKMMG